jgi:hypothetical protein
MPASRCWRIGDALAGRIGGRAAAGPRDASAKRPFGVDLNLERRKDEGLAACLDEGVSVISLFWDDPAPLVQATKAQLSRIEAFKLKAWSKLVRQC